MKRRGVSFLEMLAMEMKAEGKYVARGLSFRCGGSKALVLCVMNTIKYLCGERSFCQQQVD